MKMSSRCDHTPRLSEVAGQLVEARRLSLVVVDDDGRPIGRILADDVLDALVPPRAASISPSF